MLCYYYKQHFKNFFYLVAARALPFRVGVNFNNAEIDTMVADSKADVAEQSEAPGGIVGFKISYWQGSC